MTLPTDAAGITLSKVNGDLGLYKVGLVQVDPGLAAVDPGLEAIDPALAFKRRNQNVKNRASLSNFACNCNL